MNGERSEVLERAIQSAGGRSALAGKLGIKPQAISQWTRVPAERMGHVSHITGIPIRELRPDLFPEAVS